MIDRRGFVHFLVFSANARQADEGRSFFAKKVGGNRVGEQILGEKVRISSDLFLIERGRSRAR